MVNNYKKKQPFFLAILIVLAAIGAIPAFAQDKPIYTQNLEWILDENALSYKVEVESLESGEITKYETEDNFITLSLPAGKYRYRIFAYDFLGKEADATPWIHFEILKVKTPEITKEAAPPVFSEDSDKYEIAIDIADITDDTVVELVNEETGEVIRGELVVRAVKAQFDDLPEGEWKMRVTNPGGVITESNASIEVDEELAKEKEKFAEPEVIAEEENPEPEAEPVEIVEKPVKPKKVRPPYVPKNIFITFGAGVFLSPYDGNLMSYSDTQMPIALDARISVPFVNTQRHKLAIEASAFATTMSFENTYIRTLFDVLNVSADLQYRFGIWPNKIYLSARAGAGLFFLSKEAQLLEDFDDLDQINFDSKMNCLSVQGGLSLIWIPTKYMVVETGADFTHLFATDMPTGIINPYLSIGLRL